MAHYHFNFGAVSRGKKDNALSSAAYISRSKLVHEAMNPDSGKAHAKTFDYRNKDGLVYDRILAPEGAPNWVYERKALWSKCEEAEVRSAAIVAWKARFALPRELTLEQNIALVEEFVRRSLTDRGMVADIAIHYDSPGNPHVHLMMTTRMLEERDGSVEFSYVKERSWGRLDFIKSLRREVADIINEHLEFHGHTDRVSHLSHKERGIDITPGIHEGPARYIKDSVLVAKNRKIQVENAKRIREDPELVFDKLSITKLVFSKEDIARVLTEALTTDMELEAIRNKKNIEDLNADLHREFTVLFAELLASDKIKLINEKYLNGRTLYAFSQRIELEQRFEQGVQTLFERGAHKVIINAGDLFDKTLSDEQQQVALEVLSGNDIVNIEGLPGAGKTTAMREVVAQYRKAGFEAIGAATSSAAALNLGSVAGIDAMNITQWRKTLQENAGREFEFAFRADYYKEEQYLNKDQENKGRITNKHIIMVDEASMVDLTYMDYLGSIAIETGAKIINLGDLNQLPSQGMGGGFKRSISICGSVKLTQVKRQKNSEHARATALLSKFEIDQAINIYKEQECFVVSDISSQSKARLIDDYVSDVFEEAATSTVNDANQAQKNKRRAICVYTNSAVSELNIVVRKKLKDAGYIKGEGKQVTLGGRRIELCVGERIIFGQNSKQLGVLNGELGKVLGVEELRNTILKEGESQDREIIKILVYKADGSEKVVEVDTSKYRSLDYGYALTAHKLQGATVDSLFLLVENGMGYEAFNVGATRHKERVKFYVNKKELEDVVYKRLAEDAKLGRKAFTIKGSNELWQTGLNIALTRRADLSFTGDYANIEVTKEEKVILAYIESRELARQYIEEISKWVVAESRRRGTEVKIWESELWQEYTEQRVKRDSNAQIITANYPDYGPIITRLNLNYSTIKKHVRHSDHQFNVKALRREYSVSGARQYRNIIEELLNLTDLFEKGEAPDGKIRKEIYKYFNRDYRDLINNIAEAKILISELEQDIEELELDRYALEDRIVESRDYRDKACCEIV